MPIIHEKRNIDDPKSRVKGVEFDLEKNAKGDMKDVIDNDQYNTILKMSGQSKSVLSTTSTGVDVTDSRMKSRIEAFDKEKAKAILESDNIVKEYNKWIDAEIDEIIKVSDPAKNTPGVVPSKQEMDKIQDDGMSMYIAKFISLEAQNMGIDKTQLKNYLRGTFFYTSDNPNNIKLLLTLRLKYNQKITSLLNRMLSLNYKILGYTDQEAKELINTLNGSGNGSNKVVKQIKEKIFENRNKFIKNNGECVDLTSLGFGKIFITKGKDFNGINTQKSIDNDSGNETEAIDAFLQKAMVNDVVILCHGMSSTDSEYDDMSDELSAQKALLKGYGADDKQLDALQSLDRTGKSMAKDDIKAVDKKRWKMQPIRSDKSDYYTDMNSFVRELIKEGYKKILIGSCNPGSHKLDADIMSTPGVRITYSDFSNIIENACEYDLTDPLDSEILEGEMELMELAESCGIDYNSINIDEINFDDFNCDILDEGVISNIKEYATKVVKFILGLFQKLWRLLKRFKDFIVQMFNNFTGRGELPKGKQIKLKMILSEAKTQEYTITNMSQLSQIAKKSCDSIQKELSKRQAIQVKATKQLNDLAQKLQEKPVKEDYVYEDDLLDFLGYSTVSEALVLNEAVLSSKERKDLPSTAFGLPDKRKFPLNDYDHVIMAIKFFNRCDKKDQEELAKNIVKAMKKYKVTYDKIGKNNKLRNYISNLNESTLNEGLFRKDPYKTIIKKYKNYRQTLDCTNEIKDIENSLVPEIVKNVGINPDKIEYYFDNTQIDITFKTNLSEYDNVKKMHKLYDDVAKSKGVTVLYDKYTNDIIKYKNYIIYVWTNDEDDELCMYGFQLRLSILYCKKYADICKIPISAIETLCKSVIIYDTLVTPEFISFFVRTSCKDEYPKIEQETGCKIIPKMFRIYVFPNNIMSESVGNPVVGLNTERQMVVDNMYNNAFTSLEVDNKIIKDCITATTKALLSKEDKFYIPYIPYIQESLNIDPNIGFYKDTNGIFVMNENTGLRSPSYKDVDDIDDRTILYITYGELNDAKMNDL